MTVKELLFALADFDPEATVYLRDRLDYSSVEIKTVEFAPEHKTGSGGTPILAG